MKFTRDIPNQLGIDSNSSSLTYQIKLDDLNSNNEYIVRMTIGQTNYSLSSLAVKVNLQNPPYGTITLYPKTLFISSKVNDVVTTNTIDIEQEEAYQSGSYKNLIYAFFLPYWGINTNTLIPDFFNLVPDFTSEQIILVNPLVNLNIGNYTNYRYQLTVNSTFDLYPEPVDNSNQFQLLNSLNQASGSHLTSDDYHDIMAIETYNRNYLLAHLQPNVTGNLDVTGDINASTSSPGGGSSTVDLSGVVNQLQNINQKLNYEDVSGDADIAELLYWIAQALQGGLVYADEQQGLHSYLHFIGKKLEYTETIEEEEVTKNISQLVSELSQKLQDLSDRPIINTNEDLSPWSAV